MNEIFEKAFRKVVELEGGFKLHKNPTETAVTYAGIYRKAHPEWEGWSYIDRNEIPPTDLVRKFYYENYWKHFDYPQIKDKIKAVLFESAVNIGVIPTIKLAQQVLGVVTDGIIGKKTLKAFESVNESDFIKDFILVRIAFYLGLVNKNPKRYSLYLRGWLNRVFEVLNWISKEV